MKGSKGRYLKIQYGFEHWLIFRKCRILPGQPHLLDPTSEVRGM